MTKRAIDRLGALSYGVLMLGIINGVFLSPIQNGLTHEARGSLRVFILLMSVAVNVGGLIVAYYCLYSFIRHLFTENKHLGGAGKALWLVLRRGARVRVVASDRGRRTRRCPRRRTRGRCHRSGSSSRRVDATSPRR